VRLDPNPTGSVINSLKIKSPKAIFSDNLCGVIRGPEAHTLIGGDRRLLSLSFFYCSTDNPLGGLKEVEEN